MKKSNLRGRGGGGFPAGRKWEGSRNAPDEPKYVIVNADEGDPGAFMDRSSTRREPSFNPRGVDHRRLCHRLPRRLYLRSTGIPPGSRECAPSLSSRLRRMVFLGKTSLAQVLISRLLCTKGPAPFVCGESTALMTLHWKAESESPGPSISAPTSRAFGTNPACTQ